MCRLFGMVVGGAIILSSVVYGIHHYQSSIASPIKVSPVYDGPLHQAYYMRDYFYDGIVQADYVQKITEPIYGGIVSHHLLTTTDIAATFAELKDQPVSTIVLIGPNHFTIGEAKVAISQQAFDTPWGKVLPDTDTIQSLLDDGVVTINEEPFRHEHSISSLVPFLAYHLPGVRVVPIILQRGTSRVALDALVESFQASLPPDSVVMASVDFSHHLNRLGAIFHDVASVSAIADADLDRILALEIDSPPSIYTLVSYLQQNEALAMRYKNTISTDYTGHLASEDTTSYVFAHFTKGKTDTPATATSLHFGDMAFSGEVASLIEAGGDPFISIQGVEGNFLRGVDLTMGNFEGVITDTLECDSSKEVLLRFPASTPALLARYNFDGVTVANNHNRDCFDRGYTDTLEALREAKLFAVDTPRQATPRVYRKQIGERVLTVVGIDALGREVAELGSELQLVKQLSREGVSIIVHVHWGSEYIEHASSVQRKIGEALIDAGASAVIGHHPHVVQEVERYKNGIIAYSLGNFIFDQPYPSTTVGIGLGLIHGATSTNAIVFPFESTNLKPQLMLHDAAMEYCAKLRGVPASPEACQL